MLMQILIPALFTIFGVLVGSYVNHKNSYNLYKRQKIYDSRRIAYSKVMALKIPWIQSVQTNGEAKLLCEFYETRFLQFSNNIDDFNEARKQNERALSLIKDVSNYQMQFFETLGLIQTCFKINSELESAIDNIYNYSSIEIDDFPKNFLDQSELDTFLKIQNENLKKLINTEYKEKINTLIKILKIRLIEE